MLRTTALRGDHVADRRILHLVEPVAGPTPEQLAAVSPRLLTCFLTVAEELHFGRAADRLFVAQPALSRSVQQLERILGRQLFVRTTRSVQLTPSAQALLAPAHEVLNALAAFAAEMDALHPTLRIAHVPGSDTTARILDHVSRSAGSLEVEEQLLGGSEQLAAVADGRLDVALCRAPALLPQGLRAQLVRLDPLLIAVIGRDAGNTRPVDARRRTVATCAGRGEDRDYTAFVSAYECRAGCRLRQVGAVAGSGTEAFAMRRNGAHAFVTLASRSLSLDTPCPVAGALPVQGYFPWSVVWRANQRSPAVRAYVAAAQDVATALGWQDTSLLPGEPWVPDDDDLAASGCHA